MVAAARTATNVSLTFGTQATPRLTGYKKAAQRVYTPDLAKAGEPRRVAGKSAGTPSVSVSDPEADGQPDRYPVVRRMGAATLDSELSVSVGLSVPANRPAAGPPLLRGRP